MNAINQLCDRGTAGATHPIQNCHVSNPMYNGYSFAFLFTEFSMFLHLPISTPEY